MLVDAREQARASKEWSVADEIRTLLRGKDVQVDFAAMVDTHPKVLLDNPSACQVYDKENMFRMPDGREFRVRLDAPSSSANAGWSAPMMERARNDASGQPMSYELAHQHSHISY